MSSRVLTLLDALKSYEVSFVLLPMISKQAPKSQPGGPSKGSPSNSGAPKGTGKGAYRAKPYSTKGKGKTKGRNDQRVPQQIRDAGGTATTPDGQPICFDYSLRKCREQVTEGRCKKGHHV